MQIHFIPHASAALRVIWRRRSAAAVIDVLRATTTITAALQAGCDRVIPCASLGQARRQAVWQRRRGREVILAGERGGKRVPGFDLGNSPREFKTGLRGKTVILATTNGTKALSAASGAGRVMAVCLNNLTAAARGLAGECPLRLVILAAGESGDWSGEDTAAGGLLIRRLIELGRGKVRPVRDLDRLAKAAYAFSSGCTAASLPVLLRMMPHGRDLIRMGFRNDVQACARLDTTDVVGVLAGQGIRKYRG